MCAIIKAYEKKMKKAIILCEIKEKSLKPYFTSKKEKKKDINATKYDESKIIDTQTFLFDNESNVDNNFINKRSRSEVYNINSSHNNMNNNILFKTNTIPTDYINEEKNFELLIPKKDINHNTQLNIITELTNIKQEEERRKRGEEEKRRREEEERRKREEEEKEEEKKRREKKRRRGEKKKRRRKKNKKRKTRKNKKRNREK